MAAGPGSKRMQYDYLVKLLLIGDSGVGKSSLLLKYTEDRFIPHMSQTIGMDFKIKMLELGGKRVKLQIWDTAGQERFHTITQQYYRNAMGVVLVYDATSEESFQNIRRWAAQIAAHGEQGTDRLLIGNKADADPSARVVTPEQGKALADEYGIPFFETSAKSGLNVEDAFLSIADAIRRRLHNKEGPLEAAASGLRLSSGKELDDDDEGSGKPCCSSG
eukprot:TRINITY_DN29667_c0_g1_i1.p1 TRINITY_DN29667_c0_g1~~TRINITY_DN29667_c0_g1_i1.p1  ORF type:complete len:231 (+),score=44.23 TRINITY_DN29667_c0_g1_i1:38-694(+)